MKVKATFIKKHVSGVPEGKELELEFTHAERLLEQGFIKVENWDELKSRYDKECVDALERQKERLAQKQKEEEENKMALEAKRKENETGKNRRQYLQTTDDLKTEEPKNSKKGGKK